MDYYLLYWTIIVYIMALLLLCGLLIKPNIATHMCSHSINIS